jgi:hypothetical protein|tara:strand:- start:2386 stop:2577 length:192 start_codon:yes stop_codon:yes gene_type:complete
MSGVVSYVMENYMQMLTAVGGIVGGFAIIASMTPNKSDDRIVQMILDMVNFIGANFGKAKNGG